MRHTRTALVLITLVLSIFLLPSCGSSPAALIAAPTLAPSNLPTASPSPTGIVHSMRMAQATSAATFIVPAETNTPAPPSLTPTITDTPGPFEHEVLAGETLLGIVAEYGHTSFSVMDMVVQMNPNVPNRDVLPAPGSIILVPRPTATPIPPGGEATATFIALNPPTATPEILTLAHVVEDGQTMVGITGIYNTTMLIMRTLNPRLNWSGCNFSIPSGGDECNPLLNVGQELIVPAPTPTPTLSPTPAGNETATPTPVRGPVRLLAPAPGVIIAGGPVVLSWASAGILEENEVYQVTFTDQDTGIQAIMFTRENTLVLPGELQPTDTTPHNVTWQVMTARVRPDFRAETAGVPSEVRAFQWVAP